MVACGHEEASEPLGPAVLGGHPVTTHARKALRYVSQERRKQRALFSDHHDDQHQSGELVEAATALLVGKRHWWGLHYTSDLDRVVTATALLVAEIERRIRAGETHQTSISWWGRSACTKDSGTEKGYL